MGRPLNKKYFGNRNYGVNGEQITDGSQNSRNTADDHIGGEGIASINWSDYGSWRATAGVPLDGLMLPAPSIPGGVQATWTNYFGASTVVTGAGHSGLIAGETYTYAGFPGSIITVATVPGVGNATFTVTNPGSSTTLPTDTQGVYITLRTGQGHTGAAQFLVDINTKIVNTVINNRGSGYTGAESINVDLDNGASGSVPQGTIVLTTDSGAVGSASNQENAIIIHGTSEHYSVHIGDIIKQVNTRSYKVRLRDDVAICKLVANASPAVNQAYIKATDANGSTYFVTKLTGHKATLVRWETETSFQFATGAVAPWSFTSAASGRVIIENA